MLWDFLHNNILFIFILCFLAACILVLFLIRSHSHRKINKITSFRDIDPDSLPDLKKKIFWVKIQVLIGLVSLIVFIGFFSIGKLFLL